MQYGHFDDAKKEYVITRPDTPTSWSNYLGSTDYGAIITNNAGGYSFYRSGALGRFMRLRFNSVPMDQPGRYFYIRDNAGGDYWSASWQPVGKPLDKHKSICRHGTGYTIIESQYAEIASEAAYFVPLGRNFECWLLKLTNNSARRRDLSVFSYVELANNWSTTQDQVNIQYSHYIVKTRFADGMLAHSINDHLAEDPADFTNNDQCRHVFLGLAGAKADGFDGDREAFIGPYRRYDNPLAVERGKCSGSNAFGDNGCGAFQVNVSLEAGQSREFMLVMGVGRVSREGKAVLKEFDTVGKARAALEELKTHWHGLLGRLTVQSPDAGFNSMVNVWNAYNCLITYNWSRAASLVYNGERDGLGYRDSVQDMLGVMPAIAPQAVGRLELLITGQCSTGGAMPIVRPFAHRPGKERLVAEEEYRSDDCLWLFNAVSEYVKETGDAEFLNKPLPYADSGQASVMGHLRRALEFNLSRTGADGLPCGLLADWNDCIKFGPKGQSMFVAMQVRLGLKIYAEMADLLKQPDQAAWAGKALAELDRRIQAFAWDGAWFVRGSRADGSIIGTKNDPEGTIFLEPQVWSVISGAADDRQAVAAMDSVRDRLATEYGIMICSPPFVKTGYHVVRAVLMNEGCKENAGIFSHTQGWAVIAETMLGRGDQAWQYYSAYMPAAYNTRAEIRQIEPYVHCQSTHSRHSKKFGISRIPWLSGTASWSYYAATQYILGIRPDWHGLLIDPCIPRSWDGFTVKRIFRGATYNIEVKNTRHVCKGVKQMTVDGKAVEGNLLAPAAHGANVNVIAELET
ncbi:MAG: N,N'-diacetylchitobiose phosphorylase [Planctomycetes bacterium]|nr:N,N'-diacetylchitobiose phosphorylase [Planctomycetota bacterium]